MVIMLAGFVAVIARGAVVQGGLAKIWEDAAAGGRLVAFEYVNNNHFKYFLISKEPLFPKQSIQDIEENLNRLE